MPVNKFNNNSSYFVMPHFLEEIIESGSSWLCTHNNITYQTALLYNKETIIPGVSRSSLLRVGILNIEAPTRGLQYYNVLKAVIKYTDSGDTPYYIIYADIGRPIAMELILTPVVHYKLDRDKLALLPPEERPPLMLEYKPEDKADTNNNVVINKNYKRKYYNKHNVIDIAKFNQNIRVTSLLNTIEYNIDKMLLESNILINHYANTNERLQVIAVMNIDLFTILTKSGTEVGLISTTTYDVMCVCTRALVTKFDLLLMPMLHDDKEMANVIDYTLTGQVMPLYSNVTFRLYNVSELIPKPVIPEPEIIDPNKEPKPDEDILEPEVEDTEPTIPEEDEIDIGFTQSHSLTMEQIQEILANLEQDGTTLTEDEIEEYIKQWIESNKDSVDTPEQEITPDSSTEGSTDQENTEQEVVPPVIDTEDGNTEQTSPTEPTAPDTEVEVPDVDQSTTEEPNIETDTSTGEGNVEEPDVEGTPDTEQSTEELPEQEVPVEKPQVDTPTVDTTVPETDTESTEGDSTEEELPPVTEQPEELVPPVEEQTPTTGTEDKEEEVQEPDPLPEETEPKSPTEEKSEAELNPLSRAITDEADALSNS